MIPYNATTLPNGISKVASFTGNFSGYTILVDDGEIVGVTTTDKDIICNVKSINLYLQREFTLLHAIAASVQGLEDLPSREEEFMMG